MTAFLRGNLLQLLGLNRHDEIPFGKLRAVRQAEPLTRLVSQGPYFLEKHINRIIFGARGRSYKGRV
ncbi:hypothetical protein ES703_94409 [subsurface metagenome]